MNEYWLKLKEWWFNLALREKQAVAIGGMALGLFIIYQMIWSPIVDGAASMRSRIVAEQKTLVWMQGADKEISKMQGQTQDSTKAISPVVLLGLLQKQIEQAGLQPALTQLKQATNDSIELHFQKVEFDKLVKLLTSIAKQYRVSIAQMSAIADATPGIVNADVVLKL